MSASATANISVIDNHEARPKESKDGELQTVDKTYVIVPFENTEEATQKTFEFLQSLPQPDPEAEFLHEAVILTPEMAELEELINSTLLLLTQETPKEERNSHKSYNDKGSPVREDEGSQGIDKTLQPESLQKATPAAKTTESEQVEEQSSNQESFGDTIFTLAKKFSASIKIDREQNKETKPLKQNESKEQMDKLAPFAHAQSSKNGNLSESFDQLKEREKEERENREGKKDQDSQDQDENNQKKKKHNPYLQKDKEGYRVDGVAAQVDFTPRQRKIEDSPWSVKASTSKNEDPPEKTKEDKILESFDSIYLRFMALMARILGQAEASAHELYQKIKHRTDNIDLLTNLLAKINAEKGDIDWSKNEEMKKLIDQARELGVEIPPGKYSWKKDEKALLKDNIQMKKDSLEKITQLERTDMQRYLQEASQCHQARSNILKVMKEVGDTFIHNIRPS